MSSHTAFDYAIPYDIMVGRWSGMTTTFDARGEYVDSVASLVTIYWKEPHTLLHYEQQELADLDAVLTDNAYKAAVVKIVSHDFDLKITGKSCTSTRNKENVRCVGAETSPGIYLFHLTFPGFGHYYNNQYFTNPNERHIIGPFVHCDQHDPQFIVAQTFTRISYDVPKKYRRELRRKR
jgi:hypothetical protein